MKLIVFFLAISLVYVSQVSGFADWSEDQKPEKWFKNAKDHLDRLLKQKHNTNIAKNLIMFLGDGMGITTVTAGRIHKGQLKGQNGEEERTWMEKMDNQAFSKTYNIDAQTADSAGTATAYLSGTKTRIGVIGVDGFVQYDNCNSSKGHGLESIAKWAHEAGKSVGIVTTTRVTHASPAGCYAKTPHRDWEAYDNVYFTKKEFDEGCKDIAAQLIEDNSFINLVFGGGRTKFMPNDATDYDGKDRGSRVDGRNLIREWEEKMESKGKSYKFIWNATQLRNLEVDQYDNILGLFAPEHMEYEKFRKNDVEPSIVEMTEKAIEILSRNKNGFFLFVEGGKIDHAHHNSQGQLAVHDFMIFDEAIGAAYTKTNTEETMIAVTADHSHTVSLGGYSIRGNLVYGISYNHNNNYSLITNQSYTSMLYANGPGGLKQIRNKNLTEAEVNDPKYLHEAAVYLKSETHGGEDVPIYSSGPMSFLFTGTVEQSYITHAMAYSACIYPYNTTECRNNRGPYTNPKSNSSSINSIAHLYLYLALALGVLYNF